MARPTRADEPWLGAFTRLASGASSALGRASQLLSRVTGAAGDPLGAARSKFDDLAGSRLTGGATGCLNSFLAATLVATPAGFVPIGQVSAGDQVTAYDETTGAPPPTR